MQLAMIAAGFTAGEADQLRRAMAAWKKKGGLEPFEKKLTEGMLARGYSQQWTQQIYKQICGFGEYGFPESHAASFALLAYQTAWLKCHYPAAFAAALINSQPMGFYTPSQITQDAARHGVVLLPADVCVSDWDCTLEVSPTCAVGTQCGPALRLGLRLVKGLSEQTAQRIADARSLIPYKSTDDLAQRAQLHRHDLAALTRADALRTLSGHRRQAYWDALGFERDQALVVNDNQNAVKPVLPKAQLGEEIIDDYNALGLSLRAHPLALLRAQLSTMHFTSASGIAQSRHKQIVRVCGLVTCRQRPETAKGVTFITLEDETGMINIVVWPDLGHRQRNVLIQAQLMTVFGHVQREGDVIHVVAGRLRDDSQRLLELRVPSRDFH
jgi:error-prone DNA polymerase